MALIKCPECHKKVSNEAEKCVHCGATITREYAENAEVVPVHWFARPKWLNKKIIIALTTACLLFIAIFGGINIYRQSVINKFKGIVFSKISDNIYDAKSDRVSDEELDKIFTVEHIYQTLPNKDAIGTGKVLTQEWYNDISDSLREINLYNVVLFAKSSNVEENGYYRAEVEYNTESKEYICTGVSILTNVDMFEMHADGDPYIFKQIV